MDELIAFWRARLDEDEAAAKAAEHNDGPYTLSWTRGGGRHLTFDNHRSEDYEAVFAGNWDRILIARDSIGGAPLAAHIARHDPACVLRDVEADRKLLFRYQIGLGLLAGKYKLGYCEALEEVIKIRAARFGDHPGYRPEWAPLPC